MAEQTIEAAQAEIARLRRERNDLIDTCVRLAAPLGWASMGTVGSAQHLIRSYVAHLESAATPPQSTGDVREPVEDTAPVRVTFVTWDADTDGVAVLHDGEEVWAERSFDSLDQYLKSVAPVGQPVIINHTDR